MSAFVVSSAMEDYSEHDAEEDASRKISRHLLPLSLLTTKIPTIVPNGIRTISSKSEIGKPPYSVRASITISSRIGLSRAILRATKLLNNQISTLNQKFMFLETVSLYYYSASAIRIGEIGKFSARQFIDAAISLESLFNDGIGDIAYKICMRTALILGLLDHEFESEDVFKTMKKLYNMRNDIVHGAAKQQEEYTYENVITILRYAKNALICCYILSLNRQHQNANELKKNLVNEIDTCLLDLSHRKRIRKEIVRGFKRFKPS